MPPTVEPASVSLSGVITPRFWTVSSSSGLQSPLRFYCGPRERCKYTPGNDTRLYFTILLARGRPGAMAARAELPLAISRGRYEAEGFVSLREGHPAAFMHDAQLRHRIAVHAVPLDDDVRRDSADANVWPQRGARRPAGGGSTRRSESLSKLRSYFTATRPRPWPRLAKILSVSASAVEAMLMRAINP